MLFIITIHVAEIEQGSDVHDWRVRDESRRFPAVAEVPLAHGGKTPAAHPRTARRGGPAKSHRVWVLSRCHFQQLMRRSARNIGLLW